MQLRRASQPISKGLAPLLILAGLVSSVLVGWGITRESALTKLPFIILGVVMFLALTRHLSLPLMEITIFVSVVLAWSFQYALSPFSLLGWGVTYNDILMVLCMVNWALLVFTGRKIRPEKQLVKPLFLFLIYMVIPILYTVIRTPRDIQWIPSEIGYLFYYLLIFPFSYAVEEKGAIDRLTKVLLSAIIVAAVLIALYNQGVLYIPSRTGRGFGGGRANEVSDAIVSAGFFFAGAVLILGKCKRSVRLIASLALASSALLMLLSQTRLLLISIPAGLVALLFVMRSRYEVEGDRLVFGLALSRWLMLLLVIGVIVLGISVLFPEARDEFLARWRELSEPEHISVVSRKTDVTILLPYALAENPITGVGIGRSYEQMAVEYQLGSARGAHSIWVYLFVKTGIVGVLLFLNLQYAILRTAYTIWADRTTDPMSVAWAAAIFTSLVATLVLSSFYTVANLTEDMTIIYCLFLAILNSFLRQERPEVS